MISLQLVKYDVWIHHDFFWDDSSFEDQKMWSCQSSVFLPVMIHRGWSLDNSRIKKRARNDKFRMVWKDDSFITSRYFQVVESENKTGRLRKKTSFFLIQLVLECNETRLFPTKKGVTQGNGNWTHNMWVFPVDAENWTHRRRSLICKPVQLYMHMI